jgi:hypothetical protein
MGTVAGGPGRKLVLQIAGCAAMVFEQHRIPSRPPSEPQNPELSLKEVLRIGAGAANEGAPYDPAKLIVHSTEFMG